MCEGDTFVLDGRLWTIEEIGQDGITCSSTRPTGLDSRVVDWSLFAGKQVADAGAGRVPCDCPLWSGCKKKDIHR